MIVFKQNDDFQPHQTGNADCGSHCDVCKEAVTDGCGARDEDDRFWCVPCMLKWEHEHGCHWENGQSLKEEKK